ncbi:hypothetical protein O7632_07635 [Solwaraspora sp. WMMD406]|uniref:hypothetical protein n=1 Tax=Solwaraspora sp. WMMD406 TaxID=3016095 RepID=UPI00241700B4|nr:hypothetical protein [Solwaraspora sp. WMMD406]MDG4763977.1 hypothetical protein [Solwaraspora sp. WMMD406]
MPTNPSAGVDSAATPAVTSAVADRRAPALRRFAVSITVLTVAGHWFLGFEQAPVVPLVVVGYAYLLDLALEWSTSWARHRRPGFVGGWRRLVDHLLPTHISALACAMLLYANSSPWPYLFAITAAVSSRYLIRIRIHGRRRHVLNPSNTGITLTLLLYPWVSIAPPYQFTADIGGALDWLVPAAVLIAGTMINAKLTGRMPLIAGWLVGFVGQAVVRWAFADHALPAALMPMIGLAFILFTNYMITDPGTTPLRPTGQILFGVTTAMVYGLLVVSDVSYGLFLALSIVCLVRGLLLAGVGLRVRGPVVPVPGRPTAVR